MKAKCRISLRPCVVDSEPGTFEWWISGSPPFLFFRLNNACSPLVLPRLINRSGLKFPAQVEEKWFNYVYVVKLSITLNYTAVGYYVNTMKTNFLLWFWFLTGIFPIASLQVSFFNWQLVLTSIFMCTHAVWQFDINQNWNNRKSSSFYWNDHLPLLY